MSTICPDCSSPLISYNHDECISALGSRNVQVPAGPALPEIQGDVAPTAAAVRRPIRERWSFPPPSVAQKRTFVKQEVKASSSSVVPKNGVSEEQTIKKRELRQEEKWEENPMDSLKYRKIEEGERGNETKEEEMTSVGRKESEETQPILNDNNIIKVMVSLMVSGHNGNEIFFRIKRTMKMAKLMRIYSDRIGVPIFSLRFLFNGRRIHHDETATDLAMNDDDAIEVYTEQPAPIIRNFHNLDEGAAGHPPLDPTTIHQISSVLISQDHADAKLSCSVCLELFTIGEEVKKLECGHLFHIPCIQRWLKLHGTCPVCRKLLVPVGSK